MDLTVRFSGLCNFVPVFNAGTLEKVWVLLVNAEDPDTIPGGKVVDGELVAFAHWPFVRFPLEYVAPGAPPDAFGLWPLEGSDLEVLDGNGRPILGNGIELADPPVASVLAPASSGEEKSIRWLGETGKAEARHAKVKGDCISSDLSRVPRDIVSARVPVFGGVLSTSALVDRTGMPIVWEFNPPDPPTYTQALSEEISLDVMVATSSITLSRINRESGGVQRLSLAQIGGKIDISIINLEPDSILGVGDRKRSYKIEEFRWFYKLSVNAAQAPYPIPVADPTLGGNPYCPMSRSEA